MPLNNLIGSRSPHPVNIQWECVVISFIITTIITLIIITIIMIFGIINIIIIVSIPSAPQITRSSKDECSTGSNNHYRSIDFLDHIFKSSRGHCNWRSLGHLWPVEVIGGHWRSLEIIALWNKSNGSYDIKDFGTLPLIFSTSKYFRRKFQPCPSFFSHPNIPDK